MEYKIITSSSPQGLSSSVNQFIEKGWEPKGSHQVTIVHIQNRFRGDQLVDTINETEYSQTIIKNN